MEWCGEMTKIKNIDDVNLNDEIKKISEFYIKNVKIPILTFGFETFYNPSDGLPLKITVEVEVIK